MFVNIYIYMYIFIIGKNGIEVGVTKTHGECGDVKSLEFIRNVTNNKYFELA
jgi:hypothetical protein